MAYKLDVLIYKKDKVYKPVVLNDLSIDIDYKSPAKLDFSVLKQDFDIQEGDKVTITKTVGDKKYKIFYGFIFSRSLNKDDVIKLTAYDQLRYFKNKHLMIYENLTLGGVFKKCCEDFNLKYVIKADSKNKIPHKVEIDKTLFDIVESAMDSIRKKEGELYTIYDDFGVLTLNKVKNMNTFSINSKSASDFSYETTIDDETYNKIVVYKEFDDKNSKKIISENKTLESQWGTLQLVQKAENDTENIQETADNLLKEKGKRQETFSLSDIQCETWMRPCDVLFVELDVDGKKVSQKMRIESIKHKFNTLHTVDIKLRNYDLKDLVLEDSSKKDNTKNA